MSDKSSGTRSTGAVVPNRRDEILRFLNPRRDEVSKFDPSQIERELVWLGVKVPPGVKVYNPSSARLIPAQQRVEPYNNRLIS
jgi:hypothetical protein